MKLSVTTSSNCVTYGPDCFHQRGLVPMNCWHDYRHQVGWLCTECGGMWFTMQPAECLREDRR